MPFLAEPCPSPRLMAVCGFKYAGKSSVARAAVDLAGFRRTRFADAIRATCIAAGVPTHLLDPPPGSPADAKERPIPELGGVSARQAMESAGDWGRSLFGEAVWLQRWADRADALLRAGESIVVDDLRYDLEDDFLAEWAESRGVPYLVVRVDAAGREDARPTHSSNRVLGGDRTAIVLDNRPEALPTEADLRRAVARLLQEWEARLAAGLAPACGRTRW